MSFVSHSLFLYQRLRSALGSRWRNVFYRLLGVRFNGYVWLRRIEIPRDAHNIQFNGFAALDQGVVLLCTGLQAPGQKIVIGNGTYINRRTFIDASELIVIGDDCAIGPNCYITDHDHGMDPAEVPLRQALMGSPTRIGNRVWLGANVVVLKGVTIGDDVVVGAGSVVTRSLPAGTIAVGVPAKVQRYREAVGASQAPVT